MAYSDPRIDDVVQAWAAHARRDLDATPMIPFTELRKSVLTCPEFVQHRQRTQQELDDLQAHYHQLLEQTCQHADADLQHKFYEIKRHYDLGFGGELTGIDQQLIYNCHVAIIGAGLSGLLAAYVLAKHGVRVTVYEKRAQNKSCLRTENISFKEAEMRLSQQFGDELYQECFKRGAALDGQTGKLRITIGCFQEILLEGLTRLNATIHYETCVTPADVYQQDKPDVILLAGGLHCCARMELENILQPISYPEFSAGGRTALFIRASQDALGYSRQEREGEHWRRENKTVFSGQTLKHDILRVLNNLDQPSAEQQAWFDKLLELPAVEYTFNFGNDTDKFLDKVTDDFQPLLSNTYSITPMLVQHLVYRIETSPVIVIGDANGSAHPLAAIGTLKFVRNMDFLPHYVFAQYLLMQCYHTSQAELQQHCLQLIQQLDAIYQHLTRVDTEQVFFENILACLFSKPRQ